MNRERPTVAAPGGDRESSAAPAPNGARLLLDLVTIRYAPLAQKLSIAAETGFSAVELWSEDVDAAPPDGLRERCADLGLGIEGICPPTDLYRWHAHWDADLAAALRGRMETASRLGARYLVLPVMSAEGTLQTLEHNLARACELAAAFERLEVALEPIGHVSKLCRLEASLDILRRLEGHGNLRLLLDAFHFFRGGNELACLAGVDPRRIAAVQVCDGLHLPLDQMVGYRHRTYPGRGAFDVEGFCRALHATGYRGPYVVEVLNEELWRDDPRLVARTAFKTASEVLRRAGVDLAHDGTA